MFLAGWGGSVRKGSRNSGDEGERKGGVEIPKRFRRGDRFVVFLDRKKKKRPTWNISRKKRRTTPEQQKIIGTRGTVPLG